MPPKKKQTLAPAADLSPLIQAALAGNLSDDAVIAHTRRQVNKAYQPGVDKVEAGLAALRRANHAASLQNLDHAALYQELVNGSLCDENDLAIKLSSADELNGAKKVTDTCLKITALNGQGGVMTYLSDPDATRKAVKGVKLAPAEDLGPLIQAALAGNLSDDAVIAHTRSQANANYRPGVDKVGAGLAALRRANHAASLQNLDHAALYQKLVEGSLRDENDLAIKLSNADELNGAKKVTDTCLKITAPNGQGGVMTYLSAPDATRKTVKGVKLAPAEDLGPLIQAALAGDLSDDAVIAHTRSQVNKDYQRGVDKVGAGLAALRRANHAASLQNLNHAALYQELVNGSLCDENDLAIKLSTPYELNGAKKVTDTCLKITAPDSQGGVMTYLSDPDATRKAVKGVKLAPAEDLGPLIQAALAGDLSDDAVIAHTRSQATAKYRPGVDKVGAGLAALRRANHAASLQNLDHAALYQELVNGSLRDENGLAIKLSSAHEFNGAKTVTDTCLKITAPNGQGGVMTYLSDPDATRKAVTGVKLAPAEDLGPLIQAALAGDLSDDAVIAHTRSQVNKGYQPGVDKVGAGLAALRRANHAASLQNLDHADLYQELVEGSLCDENGLAIKLSNAYELNGVKKVTDTCLKITAPDGQGGVMTYLSDPDATREAVKGVKLAPAEDLGPLIQAALAGDLSDDVVIAHTRRQVNRDYQPGVDKVGAGLAALRRANHAASLQNLDHAALYQELVNGSLCDENGLAIKLSTAYELNGAKKVTDTCLKITAPDSQGGVMTYLSDPDATRKAVKGVKLAPAEDLGPLIQAALAGNLSDDAVIAHTRSQANAKYRPGVDKVGAGLAALRRANHAASLQNLDHAALYQELVEGSLCDENDLAIKLSSAHELNGAKTVTDTCLKITAANGQGGVMTYLSDPDATRKAVKGAKLAPAEDLGPLIQAALAGDLSDDAVIAHARSQATAKYRPGVDKVGAGLAALRRANHAASLQNLDHAALYQKLVEGSLCDENGLAIKLSNAPELNGAKKVTDTCLKITAPDGQGGMMTYLSAPDATRKAVTGVKLAPAADLGPLIQAALAGDLSDDAVIAHTRSQVNANYQPGVDKVGAGLAALRRANHAASLQNLDHAALYQELVNGSLCDENGLAIKLSNADELNGAKKVTDTCLKITAPNGQGGMMTYLSDPDAMRRAVTGVKLARAADLGPLIQAALAGNLSDDAVIAHTRSQVNRDYQPGVDKVGAGLAALRRANHAASLQNLDHAALYQKLVNGSLCDENGLAIKFSSAYELNGAKKVTDTCLKITAPNGQGGMMTYLSDPDATRKAVKGVKNPWLLSSKGKGKNAAPEASATRTTSEEISGDEDNQEIDAESFRLVDIEQASGGKTIATSSDRKRKSKEFAQELAESSRGHLDKFPSDAFAERAAFSESAGFGNLSKRPRKIISYEQQLSPFPILEEYNEGIGDTSELAMFERNTCSASEEQSALSSIGLQEARINHAETAVKQLKTLSDFILNSDSYNALYDTIKRLITGESGKAIENEIKKILDKGPSKKAESVLLEKMVAETKSLEKTLKPGITSHEVGDGSNIFDVQVGNTLHQSPLSQEGGDFFVTQAAVSYPGTSHPISEALFPSPQSYMPAEFNAWMDLDNPVGQQISGSEEPLIQQRRETGESSQTIAQQVTFHGEADSYMLEALETTLNPVSPHLQTTLAEPSQKPLHYSPDDAGNILHSWPLTQIDTNSSMPHKTSPLLGTLGHQIGASEEPFDPNSFLRDAESPETRQLPAQRVGSPAQAPAPYHWTNAPELIQDVSTNGAGAISLVDHVKVDPNSFAMNAQDLCRARPGEQRSLYVAQQQMAERGTRTPSPVKDPHLNAGPYPTGSPSPTSGRGGR